MFGRIFIFLKKLVIDIILILEILFVSLLFPDLNNGRTLLCFINVGKTPWSIHKLNIKAK